MACVMIGIVAARNSFSVTCGIGHVLLARAIYIDVLAFHNGF